jgi:2-keto-myo-inositol isomerase
LDRTQLAINSISTRQESFEEALEAYATAGFRNVEFHLPLLKDWLGRGRTVEEARKLLSDHGLRCIGGFEAHVDCFGPEESRAANRRLHLENASLIHELGGGTLVVGTDGPPEPSVEALDVVAEALGVLAEEMEGLDVDLALEFNWSPLVKSLRGAVAVVEKADHPRAGILFDPAHYHTTTTKFEDLDKNAVRWIKHVHLDDMRDKPGELSDCNADRMLPGEGILDLRALVSALERHGYEGYYSIEMFNEELWELPASEAARLCYESLLPLCR